MTAGKANWEQQILKQIEEDEKVTYLGAAHPELNIGEHPNFKVFEFTPNKSLDGNERYLLAGPEWSIMQQSSMLKALHDMLGKRLGYTIDFELWFSFFEYEFITALPPKSRPPKQSWKPWGKDVKNRPKKLNLMSKPEAAKAGYMAIRFWKDRSVESDSKVLVGTYTELKSQLMDEMKIFKTEAQVYGIPTNAYQEEVKFKPQVLLYFIEDLEDVEAGWSPVDGRVSFRVKNEEYNTITETKALALANKIKTEFAASNGYVWKKGKSRYSYYDKPNGYQLWLNCRDEISAISLITKVVSIQNHVFDDSKLFDKSPKNTTKAYPTIPATERIYGESKKLPRRMPIADVRFVRAELHIWGRPEPVILIDRSGVSKRALVTAN